MKVPFLAATIFLILVEIQGFPHGDSCKCQSQNYTITQRQQQQ